MIEISKEEFALWMDNPVTQAIFGAIKERKERALYMLTQGQAENQTNALRGMIMAYQDILDTRYEDERDRKSHV